VSIRTWALLRVVCLTILFITPLCAALATTPVHNQTINGTDGSFIVLTLAQTEITISYRAHGIAADHNRVYLALNLHEEIGSAVLPFQQEQEGSTVFLPFKADRLLSVKIAPGSAVHEQKWSRWKWQPMEESGNIKTELHEDTVTFHIPRSYFGSAANIDCALYAKDLSQNGGWGRFFGCSDITAASGTGDKSIFRYLELNLSATDENIATLQRRMAAKEKVRIYQLFVRLFGNTNETRKQNGTLVENGVGKFDDINDAAVASLRHAGFTHVWLTGVLQQATATDYSSIGEPADDPDLLKGLAGSPYAIKDYFDVCPDYAKDPAHRLDEFKRLIARMHAHTVKVIIDFVPNHVARSYNSDVQPDQNFGAKGNGGTGDDKSVFFSPGNNFFYLKPDSSGPPLRLPTFKDDQPMSPTCKLPGIQCDGLFPGEEDHGKVTGNNKASWRPELGDWYETAKLNYGFDFTVADKNVREYPNASAPDKTIPDTWKKMDSVIAYWQGVGVDGFRCDMSHMVPPEFWNWVIARARARHADVLFIGEAYDNDPAKVPGTDPVISKLHGGQSNVMYDLLNAGFNAVYDDPTYRAIKKIYEGPGWANDIDTARPDDFIFHNSLRYAENHDEVRLAAKSQWGGIGMNVGEPVSAILYGLSRGPVMIYNGQEVGEPGAGVEGFGGEDARTSIFDYWSMPELTKWVNEHKYDGSRLSEDQKRLRAFYTRLMNLLGEPAFRDGIFFPLNAANRDNSNYGRIGSEQPSGHWLYSFLRYDPHTGQRFLILVNLHPATLMDNVKVRIPEEATKALGWEGVDRSSHLDLIDRMVENDADATGSTISEAVEGGISIGEIPPLTARYFEIKVSASGKH
jgi:glycosidase